MGRCEVRICLCVCMPEVRDQTLRRWKTRVKKTDCCCCLGDSISVSAGDSVEKAGDTLTACSSAAVGTLSNTPDVQLSLSSPIYGVPSNTVPRTSKEVPLDFTLCWNLRTSVTGRSLV